MMRLIIIPIFLFLLIGKIYSQGKVMIEGEIIVQLKYPHSLDNFTTLRYNSENDNVKILSPSSNIILLKYDTSAHTYNDLANQLRVNKDVLYFMQNQKVFTRNTPNDQHYNKQWNLPYIGADKAWNVTTGGTTALGDEIVVAILDSGFDTDLADLKENIHQNKLEKPGDANNDGCPGLCGVDDDNDGLIDEDGTNKLPSHLFYNKLYKDDDDENGYIDDIQGLNLIKKNDVHDKLNHGTAVAGIIGAQGNNSMGVTGINWNVKLMLISNVNNVSQIIEGYEYVYNQRKLYNSTNGAKGAYIVVTNFSSGIDNEFGKDFPIWCNLYDKLGEIGVLSVGATTNKNTNVDEDGDMPTTCSSKYLISVTNLLQNGQLASAGYGKENIDIGAPGNGAITLGLGEIDDVGEFSGTSSATPHVTGSIGLLYSIPCVAFAEYFKNNPSKVDELKNYLMTSVDPIQDLVGRSVSEGKVNIFNTMLNLKEFCPREIAEDIEIINIYPNPSYSEKLTIIYNGPDNSEIHQFLIFDILGKKIFNHQFSPPLYGERKLEVILPTLTAGTYIFVLRNGKNQVSRKHVIIPN